MDADAPPVITVVDSASMSTSSGATQSTARTLILCFDGTADQYDSTNSNVVNLYSLLKKDSDNTNQFCYYQAGVGTYFNPGVVSPLFQWGAKILDEAFAWYLDTHVREGYLFLMQMYRPGDKICLFGFSRGAYTARALAGMLHKIGLLPQENLQQLPFAYQLYKKTDPTSLELAAGFKETFCRSVHIEFVGAWDTVASVGIILGKTLPFVSGNATIKTFRQALSLDEHRARFRPNLYHRPAPDAPVDAPPQKSGRVIRATKPETQRVKKRRWRALFSRRKAKAPDVEEVVAVEDIAEVVQTADGETVSTDVPAEDATDSVSDGEPPICTDAVEVWFSGCHSDVGGGATANSVKENLSDITLRWMVREIHLAKCGVAFDSVALANLNIPESLFDDGTTNAPAYDNSSTPGTQPTPDAPTPANNPAPEQGTPGPTQDQNPDEPKSEPSDCAALDAIDAVQPLHDELVLLPVWWLLEIIPLNYTWQDDTGKWHNTWSINLGRGRTIYQEKPLFHITVKERLADKTLKYKPKAIWPAGTQVYVC